MPYSYIINLILFLYNIFPNRTQQTTSSSKAILNRHPFQEVLQTPFVPKIHLEFSFHAMLWQHNIKFHKECPQNANHDFFFFVYLFLLKLVPDGWEPSCFLLFFLLTFTPAAIKRL